MSDALLVCDALEKQQGTFTLGPLNLELRPGITCLVGPNGAGKSTFFRLLVGVDSPSRGQIRSEGSAAKRDVGYLPQSPQLPGSATCEQFLYYVAWVHRVPKGERDWAVAQALEAVRLTPQRKAKVKSLSGGMTRRLGIAHALVHDPRMLLLDEPTVGLDPKQRLSLRETIVGLRASRIVLVSTHLVEDVRSLADRVLVLDQGQVVFDGDIAALEALADATAPGDTDLERALATLMSEEQ